MDILVKFESNVHYVLNLNKVSPIAYIHMDEEDYEDTLSEAQQMWRHGQLKSFERKKDGWFSIEGVVIYRN